MGEDAAGDEVESSSSTWQIAQAQTVIRFTTQVSRELMRREVATDFIEWCAARSARTPGVCFLVAVCVCVRVQPRRPCTTSCQLLHLPRI